MTETLIAKDNIWLVATLIIGWAAISIVLEQKYKWAAKISGAIIALAGGLILSNLKIIPVGSDFEDVIWTYIIPIAIPLLLFKSNILNMGKDAKRLLILFFVASIGTTIGAIIAVYFLGPYIDKISAVAAMFSASYVGGGVNFAAMVSSYQPGESIVSAAVVADNIVMALYLVTLMAIPTSKFFRKHYKTPLMDELEKQTDTGESQAAKYWKGNEISLKDIALSIAISVAIVAFSVTLSDFIQSTFSGEDTFSTIMRNFFGNMYLILTTVTLILASVFRNFFEKLKGSQEIGTFAIYIFFVAIGIPATLGGILENAPLLFVFAIIMVVCNMIIVFGFGKIFKFSLEDTALVSNASIGGPTTAAAMAISKGWTSLVGPILFVGTLGYVIGNYIGVFIANITPYLIG